MIGMTAIYVASALLVAATIFLVVNRVRGMLFALGASLLTLIVLGAGYLALVAILLRNM